jgi:glycerol-3-phosphate dehydrogenase
MMKGASTRSSGEFSFRTRKQSIERFKSEVFDLLIIGGGITGAAVARDATSRGLKVALVERNDFAYGTSSRSSKLIHGGLRYLENLEFGLVFEALSERALLLKTAPHMVRPLPFYLPVYQGDPNGKGRLGLGLWLYDLLALFRTPGFHRNLSKTQLLSEIPFLQSEGLKGGFRYFDASMWDDVLAIETLRSAQLGGAAVANYVEAMSPLWEKDRITGFRVQDLEDPSGSQGQWDLRAHRTLLCAGPWTDELGGKLAPEWRRWLTPSKGVHIIFDQKRIPIPGAMVMSHPEDGRIAFVIPRPDFGAGVVIVGTTDGPTDSDPAKAEVDPEDVNYLIGLLNRYFPALKLTPSDILSAYVGVRPLMGADSASKTQGESSVLQKVSREHHIDNGPGGTVIVAGGKYTTHRKMAEEIVDFTLKAWKEGSRHQKAPAFPTDLKPSKTRSPVNEKATPEAIQQCRTQAHQKGIPLPEELVSRYGAEVLSVLDRTKSDENPSGQGNKVGDPEGFPCLKAQLRHLIHSEMVVHLEDFYLRRIPLYSSRKDHGLPWAEQLAQVWAQERNLDQKEVQLELQRLHQEVVRRSAWQKEVESYEIELGSN